MVRRIPGPKGQIRRRLPRTIRSFASFSGLALVVLSSCSRPKQPVESPPALEAEGATGTRSKGEEGTREPVSAQDGVVGGVVGGIVGGMGAAAPAAPSIAALPRGSAARGLLLRGAAAAKQQRFGMGGPAPHAEPHGESYSHLADNDFVATRIEPLSTFSIDVDTASYSNARRFVRDGHLPPKDSIRAEEWVNYFPYEDPAPARGEPFGVRTEVSACPWEPAHRLVRIGLKGAPIAEDNVPPRNLVFLVDVSGSMRPANRLPLVKQGLSLLARRLRPSDRIALVVYAGASGLVLPSTPGSEKDRILQAIEQLEAGGSTNGGEGIRLAYDIATRQLRHGGINRVILATDGDFNVGTTSEGELVRLIEEERKTGVFLTVLGVGEGNLKDSMMEKLADKGNGNYAYIDSFEEARKVLLREAGATLVTVAKDVKLQVEWNPSRVESYRLIGYEDRLLAKQDFNDDKKDAGEIGAGKTVTAFYEVVPRGAPPLTATVDALKYQSATIPTKSATQPELGTVSIRYKPPQGDTSTRLSRVIDDASVALTEASEDFRFGAAVASVAIALRGAPNAPSSLAAARALAEGAVGKDVSGERREFLSLLDEAARLTDVSTVQVAR